MLFQKINLFTIPKKNLHKSIIVCASTKPSRSFPKPSVDPHEPEPEVNDREDRKLKYWRESFKPRFATRTKPGKFVDREQAVFEFFKFKIELTPDGIEEWTNKKILENKKLMQRYVPERHEILGPDLATAHYLVFLGGKVKFHGNPNYITLNENKKSVNLPINFHPDFSLSEVDASGIELFYESLENFKSLNKLEKASFAKNPVLDDWCIDKMSNMFPSLKYLDISECPKVTERGLEALYRTDTLRTLIVTNFHKSPAFELTCFMLEDCIPGLKCEIRDPENNADTTE